MKDSLNGEERLAVINSLKNYADKKRVVPHTTNGKISLDLAYQALETVLPSNNSINRPQAKRQFLNPMQGNIDRFREAMDEKGLREQEIEDPQAQQNQQNLGM